MSQVTQTPNTGSQSIEQAMGNSSSQAKVHLRCRTQLRYLSYIPAPLKPQGPEETTTPFWFPQEDGDAAIQSTEQWLGQSTAT